MTYHPHAHTNLPSAGRMGVLRLEEVKSREQKTGEMSVVHGLERIDMGLRGRRKGNKVTREWAFQRSSNDGSGKKKNHKKGVCLLTEE